MLDKLFGLGRTPPWGDAPSIFRHVTRHIRRSGPGLRSGGARLPDEMTGAQDRDIVAGGHDGLLIHHLGVDENDGLVTDIYGALRQALRRPSDIAYARLYELITDAEALQYVDGVLELVLEHRELEPDALLSLARWWAREAPDRQAVKFSIALLGLFNEEQDLETIMKLGRHEEFTLFAAVAISNSREDAALRLWELARNVEGWGRIHAVELLAEHPTAEVRDWLLREGFRNAILDEYLAGVCARAGDLAGALRASVPDDGLLNSSVELVEALFNGPVEDFEKVPDFCEAVELLLVHLVDRAHHLRHFVSVHAIYRELINPDVEWERLGSSGWNEEARERIEQLCEQILWQPGWADMARKALDAATDGDEFRLAAAACELSGQDLWQAHFQRLSDRPLSLERWLICLERSTVKRLRSLVRLAEARLRPGLAGPRPLSAIGGGASEAPADERDDCLQALFGELVVLPGAGWLLLQESLQLGSPELRRSALQVLNGWGFENWPEAAAGVLEALAPFEGDEELRSMIDRLLEGGSIASGGLDESRI